MDFLIAGASTFGATSAATAGAIGTIAAGSATTALNVGVGGAVKEMVKNMS